MVLHGSYLVLMLLVVPLSSTSTVSLVQAQENSEAADGELLFSVECGRCHNHFRLANHYFRGKEVEKAKLAIDNDRFGHRMRDEKSRKAIIEYLSELINQN
ncbi:hypothetical protein ACFL17_03235 [Pseudomonadota bacterium]